MNKVPCAAIILTFGLIIAACTTTAPITYTDTFNVSSAHFREIRRGPWETVNNTNFLLALDHDEKIIHVIGRESIENDKKDNLNFHIIEPAEDWFPGAEGRILVHLGFLKRYESVREILMDAAHQYQTYAIRVSGFSLGGTWTQFFLLDVILHWPDRDIQAIFYAPANPWRSLPKKYREELEQRTVFISNIWDPVTWMRIIGFKRYGHNITIGRWWRFLPPQHLPAQMIRALDEEFPDE